MARAEVGTARIEVRSRCLRWSPKLLPDRQYLAAGRRFLAASRRLRLATHNPRCDGSPCHDQGRRRPDPLPRSEERRGGTECVSTCRSRGEQQDEKQKIHQEKNNEWTCNGQR